MPVEIRVPRMGESITEATVLKWLKREGEQVAVGEDLVELETDKANAAITSETAGVLEKILRNEGDTVTVNEVLGLVGGTAVAGVVAPVSGNGSAPPQELVAAPAENDRPLRATPLAERLAEARGVDLTGVPGTGAGGKIVRGDVERAAPPAAAAPNPTAAVPTSAVSAPESPPVTVGSSFLPQLSTASGRREDRLPMSRKRQAIADNLKNAQNTAAMLTTFNEVDMTAIVELRKRRNESFEKRNGIKLGFMSFFAKAVVGALKAFPLLNAEIQGKEIVVKHYYDLGVAVGAEGGLVVPVLRDADTKSFAEIEKEIKSLAERARDGKLAIADMMGGTFTITNGGVFGSLMSTPILNYPQVGILGMHKMQDRAVVIGGEVVVRSMMYIALSYDHRIVDGSEAVRFLVRVKEMIEDPETLLLEG